MRVQQRALVERLVNLLARVLELAEILADVGWLRSDAREPFQTCEMLGDLVNVNLVYGLPHDVRAFGELRVLLGSLLKRRVDVVGCLFADGFHQYVEDVAVLLIVIAAVSYLACTVVHDTVCAVAVFEQLLGVLDEHAD